ncbi:hypothetical protein CH299_18580 [Rhodococcus sp. 14-2686-1-2]|nr:hypothetical protein CH301_17885 [Rhodococcus sp. 15-1189-1-1a]OZF12129.1 hypothetical protein CH299_18580 [Rhodococcus sp. 14-2686-1-2]
MSLLSPPGTWKVTYPGAAGPGLRNDTDSMWAYAMKIFFEPLPAFGWKESVTPWESTLTVPSAL